MKAKITLTLSLLFAASFLYSQTTIPGGAVSGTWDLAGSPYLIEGDINIPAGQLLTIDAGVEVEFQGYHKFEVFGIIHALGTESDSITIKAKPGAYGHHGIKIFTDSTVTDSIYLKYCIIRDGNPSGAWPNNCGAGIAIWYFDNIHIDHCTFEDNVALFGSDACGGAIAMAGSNCEISNCTFLDNEALAGGGIFFWDGSDSKLTDCFFKGNNASMEGGAIGIWNGSSPQVARNDFINNTAVDYGGAISLYQNCSPLIEENYLKGNIADLGGALNLWSDCNPVIKWNEFEANDAFHYGGAISITYDCFPLIKRNLFTGNYAEYDGGAIEIMNDCSPILINNTIASNQANNHAGGVDIYGASSALLINNIIYNNDAKFSPSVYLWDTTCHGDFFNNDIQYGKDSIGIYTQQTVVYKSNIDEDPNFVGGMPCNYHLNPPSPCIDAGYDTVSYDPDGTVSDLGMFYCNQTGTGTHQQVNSTIDLTVYPNPVSNQCMFLITTPDAGVSSCNLSVYDMRGVLVDYFSVSNITYGEKVYPYNAAHLDRGTYFIRLQAGNEVVTKKVVKN